MIGSSNQECELWRPTKDNTSITLAGGSTNQYTSPYSTDVPCSVVKLTAGRRLRTFGIESDATYKGLIDKGEGVQEEDIVKVTSGNFTGEYMIVAGIFPAPPGADKEMLELEDTDEAPTV